MDTILELKDVTKNYPGVVAMDCVNLKVQRGEIHALVGENGAGKSTLIKTITGAITPTKGTILFDGETYSSFTPAQARACGIGAIYQEFNLCPEMTVWENMFLGNFEKHGMTLDKKTMRSRSQQILSSLQINIDPDSLVRNLSVGYQQMVEIAKSVVTNVKLLIMDEPSAPLTNAEVSTMFQLIGRLKKQGVTIIYISHRLEEIFAVCDRVSVMRDGKLIETKEVSSTDKNQLIRAMVGRELTESYPQRPAVQNQKETLLQLEHVTGNGLKDVSLNVYKGEILGLGGLVGAGRTELAQLLFGVARLEEGSITYKGRPFSPKNPRDAIRQGVALVPEDRKQQGIFGEMSIKDNISIAAIKELSRGNVINKEKENSMVESYSKVLRIKAPNLRQLVKNLSGGNQQKVVLAKWLITLPDIIILDEPTRGIDVGAKYEIYLLMNELIAQGKTLIMISSEMPELIGMSDRIVVLANGQITGELQRDEFDQEVILQYASK